MCEGICERGAKADKENVLFLLYILKWEEDRGAAIKTNKARSMHDDD